MLSSPSGVGEELLSVSGAGLVLINVIGKRWLAGPVEYRWLPKWEAPVDFKVVRVLF